MDDNRNNKNIIAFINLQKNFLNDMLDKRIAYQAKNLFDMARVEKNKSKSYALAMDAYEIDMNKYEYKTYAISKIQNKSEKLKEYESLYNEINNYIKMYTKEGALIKIYSIDEVKTKRYSMLKYAYITSMLECSMYDKAQELIKELISNKFYCAKCKHFLMNIYLKNQMYEKIIKVYDDLSDDSVILLLPLSFAYLKLKQYDNFVYTINKIDMENKYFKKFIKKPDKTIVDKTNDNYHIGNKKEIFFAFKHFYEIYFNDSEYINKVLKILTN